MLGQKLLAVVLGGLLVSGLAGTVMAQDAGGGDNAGGGGNRGPRDPQQMRQRFMDRMKEAMGATDEEWAALSPKIEKVSTAARQVRMGGMGMMFGGRRGGGGFGQDAETPVARATTELRDALDNKSSTPEEIARKLTALREAKEKAQTELATQQKELKELLTQRQEATLVMFGILD